MVIDAHEVLRFLYEAITVTQGLTGLPHLAYDSRGELHA